MSAWAMRIWWSNRSILFDFLNSKGGEETEIIDMNDLKHDSEAHLEAMKIMQR